MFSFVFIYNKLGIAWCAEARINELMDVRMYVNEHRRCV